MSHESKFVDCLMDSNDNESQVRNSTTKSRTTRKREIQGEEEENAESAVEQQRHSHKARERENNCEEVKG